MTIEPDFLELMPDTITLKGESSVDGWGKPTYGSAVSFSAHVEHSSDVVRTQSNREVVERGKAYLYGVSSANEYDEITLPDGEVREVLKNEFWSDENGDHHSVIHFG